MRVLLAAVCLLSAVPACAAIAQSAHLAALEGSGPAVATEPGTGGFGVGLAGLFQDPTSAEKSTGALLSVFHSTYASVDLYHILVAFRAGPRWSLHYAATEIKDLFDTSLTNADPTLGGLRARAILVGLDGTIAAWRALTISAGLSSAGDENVGERQTSTVLRLHARTSLATRATLGIHWTKAAGTLGKSKGRMQADFGIRREFGRLGSGLQVAIQQGALWRYSEVRNGISVGGLVAVDSMLSLRVGIGRYATAFGVSQHEWRTSASLGVTLGAIEVAASYTATRLGLGSGYGISVGYEPR